MMSDGYPGRVVASLNKTSKKHQCGQKPPFFRRRGKFFENKRSELKASIRHLPTKAIKPDETISKEVFALADDTMRDSTSSKASRLVKDATRTSRYATATAQSHLQHSIRQGCLSLFLGMRDTETLFDFPEIDVKDIACDHDPKSLLVRTSQYTLDPFYWLYHLIPSSDVQMDLWRYTELTAQHPSLFVQHRMMCALGRHDQSDKVFYLGCSDSNKELRGYLGVEIRHINIDLLYFAASQACKVTQVLNNAGFSLPPGLLMYHFQVWRVNRKEFAIKLGKL